MFLISIKKNLYVEVYFPLYRLANTAGDKRYNDVVNRPKQNK